MADPRFVDLNGRPPAPAGNPRPAAPATPAGKINFHDPKVQLGAGAAGLVVVFALYKRKQAAAAAGGASSSSLTGVDPSSTTGSGTTSALGGYDSTASDVYNAIEPLFEQLAGIAPAQAQQLANIQTSLTALQNGQTSTSSSSGSTGTATPSAGPSNGTWGEPAPTHYFPGGAQAPKTSSNPTGAINGTTTTTRPATWGMGAL